VTNIVHTYSLNIYSKPELPVYIHIRLYNGFRVKSAEPCFDNVLEDASYRAFGMLQSGKVLEKLYKL